MARISAMLDVGKRSLMNSQTALQTTGHNIANKNTEGYSRQRVEILSNVPVGHGKLRIGMGARAAQVTRVNNPALEEQLEKETSTKGYMEGRAGNLTRVEQVFNEQINKGLSQFIGNFFNSFRELSNNPESLATRTQVKENADMMVKQFKNVQGSLHAIQHDIDLQIQTQIEEINTIATEVARLNEKIQGIEIVGAEANDERDRRELLLKRLGEMVNIQHMESDSGLLTVAAGNSGAILVSGGETGTLIARPTPADDMKREGSFDIYYKPTETASENKMTRTFNGGNLGGLLQVRDTVINGYLKDLNDVAYTIATEVNRAHITGFDRYSGKAGLFFDQPVAAIKAVDQMNVTQDIKNDVGRIAAAASPNAPGDNRVANVILMLQSRPLMQNGEATIDDYFNSMVGQIGIMSKRATTAYETQGEILKQLNNIRESISGVSLDEEAAQMIEFQKHFDASARLIRTADEMLDTVINLKRY